MGQYRKKIRFINSKKRMNKKKISKKVLILSGNKKIFGFTTITKMAKTHIFIPKSQILDYRRLGLINQDTINFILFKK